MSYILLSLIRSSESENRTEQEESGDFDNLTSSGTIERKIAFMYRQVNKIL